MPRKLNEYEYLWIEVIKQAVEDRDAEYFISSNFYYHCSLLNIEPKEILGSIDFNLSIAEDLIPIKSHPKYYIHRDGSVYLATKKRYKPVRIWRSKNTARKYVRIGTSEPSIAKLLAQAFNS